MKKKKLKKVVIFSILIILIGVLIGGYFYLTQPSKVLEKLMDSVYQKFESITQEIKLENKPLNIVGEFKFSSNDTDSGIKELQSYNYLFDGSFDFKNEKMKMDLNIEKQKKSILDFTLITLKDDIYLKSKTLTDKTIKIPEENTEIEYTEINSTVLNKEMMKSIKDILAKSIIKEYIKKETKKITIDNKEKKVNVLSYDLNKENIKKQVNKIIDNLKKNPDLENKIKSLFNYTDEEYNKEIELLKAQEYNNDYQILISTKGLFQEVVEISIKKNNQNFFIFTNYNKYKKISIYEEGKEKLKLKINNITKEEINIDYELEDELMKGNIIYSRETVDKIISESIKITISDFNNKINSIYNLNYKIKNIDTIEFPDIEKSILIDELTTEDFNTIITNFQKIFSENFINDIFTNSVA